MNFRSKVIFLAISLTLLIPELVFADNTVSSLSGFDTRNIGTYIASIYKYAIGVVGIVATIVIMVGGFIWISSMGNAQRVNNAKEWIAAALTGLALALFSYTILWMINPSLVSFQAVDPPSAISNSDPAKPVEEEPDDSSCLPAGAAGCPVNLCCSGSTCLENICVTKP